VISGLLLFPKSIVRLPENIGGINHVVAVRKLERVLKDGDTPQPQPSECGSIKLS